MKALHVIKNIYILTCKMSTVKHYGHMDTHATGMTQEISVATRYYVTGQL